MYSLPVVPGQVLRLVAKQTLECSVQANQHRQRFASLGWALLTSPMQGDFMAPAKRHPQPSPQRVEQALGSCYLPQEDQRSRTSARSSFHVRSGLALS